MATLASISISSASGLEKALRYVAMIMGEDPNAVIVKPNLDFFDTTLSAQEVVNLVTGWQQGAYSYETLYENLQRGNIASPERDWKTEKANADAEVADRAKKALEAAQATARLNPGNGSRENPPSGE
jgi:hypothetical protein